LKAKKEEVSVIEKFVNDAIIVFINRNMKENIKIGGKK